MASGIKRQRLIGILLVLAGAASLVVFAVSQRQLDPEALYYKALQINLEQTAITCTVTETVENRTTTQAVSLDLAHPPNVRAITTLKQPGTTIATEELATSTDDYVRYTAASTTRSAADGSKPDFSKALNVWRKASIKGQETTFFGRTALGNCIVPLVHLPASQAKPLLTELRKNEVFKTNFAASKATKLNGTAVRSYDVAVAGQAYTSFMKRVGTAYGRKDLDSLKATDFAGIPAQKLKFYINAHNGQLLRIEYVGSQHNVNFSEYGKAPKLQLPQKTITSQQLQQLLKG